MMVMAVFRV